MSHLDAEFKKQSDASVRDLVASQVSTHSRLSPIQFSFWKFLQFQGKQLYGTICHSCKYTSERSSDFLEIEVNIKVHFPALAVRS